MFVFRKTWRALFSINTCFNIRPFALLSTTLSSWVFEELENGLEIFWIKLSTKYWTSGEKLTSSS